jgi:hypothetical protein
MKTNESDEESTRFGDLCGGFLDGILEPAEQDEFLELLREDAGMRNELRRQLLLSGVLSRRSPVREDAMFLRTVFGHVAAMRDESPEEFPNKVISRLWALRVRRVLALAASVVLMLGIAALWLHFKSSPEMNAMSVAVFEAPGEAGRAREVQVGERFQLGEGVSKFEFTNGAVLGVEGPADLTIRSADEVFLAYGRLNAWCPEEAHGFRVATSSARVIDLGTSFGVDARTDGSADVMVLDGLVKLDNNREQRSLTRGVAMRAEVDGELKEMAMEAGRFDKSWSVALGIRATTGQVVSVPVGTPESLAAYEDDNRIFVIPERRDFTPETPVEVNVVDTGTYRAFAGNRPRATLALESGQRIRSYLLRYNPVGTNREWREFREFTGSVTFDRPVLGLIGATMPLNRSDAMFSLSQILEQDDNYRKMRGLEITLPHPPDEFTLSDDRLTLTVRLFAGESVDEIRVITSDD